MHSTILGRSFESRRYGLVIAVFILHPTDGFGYFAIWIRKNGRRYEVWRELVVRNRAGAEYLDIKVACLKDRTFIYAFLLSWKLFLRMKTPQVEVRI